MTQFTLLPNEVKRILILGDLHSNVDHLKQAVEYAVLQKCDGIYQLGDLHFYPKLASEKILLDSIHDILSDANLWLTFHDGNHEDFTSLWGGNHTIVRAGFWRMDEFSDSLFYAPRGHYWTWGSTRFMSFGGAHSIDKDTRIRWQTKKRKLWWPEEMISQQDVMRFQSFNRPVDVMFTHDVPYGIVPPSMKDFESDDAIENTKRLSAIVNVVKPQRLFHGHYHCNYKAKYSYPDNSTLEIQGLGCDGQGFKSWSVFSC